MKAIAPDPGRIELGLDRRAQELDWQYRFHEEAELALLRQAMLAKKRHERRLEAHRHRRRLAA